MDKLNEGPKTTVFGGIDIIMFYINLINKFNK